MMKRMILLSALFSSIGLSAAENLLTNGDFREGATGWWSSVSAEVKAAGGKQGVEKDRWVAVIPDTGASESAKVLVGHSVNLESGKVYRLTYTLSVEQGGTMRHLYQMSRSPYSPLGLAENVPVEPGTTEMAVTFSCSRPADAPAHITFNLSSRVERFRVPPARSARHHGLPIQPCYRLQMRCRRYRPATEH